MVEDGAAVLGSRVHALAVRGGGVVHGVEEGEEGAVGEGGGVEGYLEGFGVWQGSYVSTWICGGGEKVDVRPVRPEHTAR